jgi:hypothetical protein
MSTLQTDTEAHAAITSLMQRYIDGGVSGRVEDERPLFAENATIVGHLGPDFISGPIQIFYDWLAENGGSSNLTHDVTNIDIAGTIATARVECFDWHGHRFTDMFTLLKTDGEWQIISKVFHLHA